MAATVVKLAVIPAAMGLASFRVYAMSQYKTETVLLSPRELSIYAPDPPATHYMNEQPGALQNGLGVVRVGLQPYVTAVKNAYTSVKVGAVTVYTAGHDTYEFLRDPSPGFMPRVGVITVSGLAGLILARKGSRLMRLGVPLGMATVGTSVCYPTQTVGVVKITGQKMYAASQYTTSMASIFKSKPKEVTPPTVSLEQAPQATIPEPDVSEAKPLPEAESSEPATPAVDKVSPTEPSSASGPVEGAPSVVEPAPQSTTEVAPAEGSIDTEPATAEPGAVTVVEQEAVQTALVPAPAPPVEEPAEEIPAPAPVEAVPVSPPAAEVIPLPPPAEETELPPLAPVEEEAAPSPPAPVEEEDAAPSPPAPVEEDAAPSPPAAEESAPAPIEGVVDPPPVAEKTAPAPVDDATPPATTEEPSGIVTKTAGKPKFAPDPKLIDLGQASPEDADLYSTRG
ncbi:MICOS complex subunit MIC27 isoform X2 [Oncorhynchus masou masou]|uniref:MICOS complex subunit MIC27 isoform X2 n=1 Tax=Oncorhynchus masou masou TaxID=90313 RepID=UPI0031834228